MRRGAGSTWRRGYHRLHRASHAWRRPDQRPARPRRDRTGVPLGPRHYFFVIVRVCAVSIAAFVLLAGVARADEPPPTKWEQLFFPFPIVGAPPQLEQQVQLFANVFTGRRGGAAVPSVEVAYIATPRLGFVATMSYQFGFDGQRWGTGDLQLLVQYLAAGSLRFDNMLSVGLQLSVPTAQNDLGAGDFLFGPFVYAAQRFWRHFILELNVTALIPTIHLDSARQLPLDALVSVLVTPVRFSVPIYLQCEVSATIYVNGTRGLPGDFTHSPAETVFLAPEIFIGPVKGMRFAAGVFFNLYGDPIHRTTYSLTASIDIPNRYGY